MNWNMSGNLMKVDTIERKYVTVQPTTIPRGVDLHLQVNPETYGRQDAFHASCVHAFVAMKPERLNSNENIKKFQKLSPQGACTDLLK